MTELHYATIWFPILCMVLMVPAGWVAITCWKEAYNESQSQTNKA